MVEERAGERRLFRGGPAGLLRQEHENTHSLVFVSFCKSFEHVRTPKNAYEREGTGKNAFPLPKGEGQGEGEGSVQLRELPHFNASFTKRTFPNDLERSCTRPSGYEP